MATFTFDLAGDFPVLDDYRNFLRMPTTYTQDDWALQNWLIPGAWNAIEGYCGKVVSEQHDEFYDGGDFSIWLRHTPVISIQLVEEGWGFTNYDLDYVEVNAETTSDMFAYSIDSTAEGKISRRSGGNVNIPFIAGEANIHVIYTAGRADVPKAMSEASMIMVANAYQQFMQRQVGNATDGYQAEGTDAFSRTSAIETIDYAMTPVVISLLRHYKRNPIIG